MMKINRKIIITISFTIVLILGLSFLIFFLQVPGIKELSEAIQKEKLDSFVRREKADKIFKLKKEMSDIEDQKEGMESVFLEKEEAVPLLRSLEKAASDASCLIRIEAADLTKVKFEQQTKSSGKSAKEENETADDKGPADKGKAGESAKADEMAKLKAHPAFNVEVSGSFASSIDFLERMENLPYFVRVLTLDLSQEEKSSQSSGAGAGTLQPGGQAVEGGPESRGKNVKLVMLVIIYSDEKK